MQPKVEHNLTPKVHNVTCVPVSRQKELFGYSPASGFKRCVGVLRGRFFVSKAIVLRGGATMMQAGSQKRGTQKERGGGEDLRSSSVKERVAGNRKAGNEIYLFCLVVDFHRKSGARLWTGKPTTIAHTAHQLPLGRHITRSHYKSTLQEPNKLLPKTASRARPSSVVAH